MGFSVLDMLDSCGDRPFLFVLNILDNFGE